MATFDKTKPVRRHKGGNIRRTVGGGYVGEIYQDRRIHRSPTFSEDGPAKAWIETRVKARNELGAVASKMTGRQIADALDALNILSRSHQGVSLSEAATFYTHHHKQTAEAWTVADTLSRYLAAMEHPQDGSSPARPRSVKNKRTRLLSFVQAYGGRRVPEVTESDVEAWLAATGAQGRNLRNYKGEVQSLMNYAAARMPGGYLNTVARFPVARAKERAPAEIVEPRHVKSVLHCIEARNPRAAIGLAIGCFAGLRTSELCHGGGLQWSDIDFDEVMIKVPASLAKTRDRRDVKILPNLLEWLLRYRQSTGRVTLTEDKFNDWRKRARAATGAQWPDNGARHSFGTYYAKLHGYRDAADLLGHVGGIRMLMDHYSGKCTRAEAMEYFCITPAVAGKVIRMKQAQA